MSQQDKQHHPHLNLDEKNLSTSFEYASRDELHAHHFIQQIVSNPSCWGRPYECPNNDHLYVIKTPFANVTTLTTYGGPGSKYKTINEDSSFFGVNVNDAVIAGVIDGAGGSRYGYMGSLIANQTLSEELYKGTKMEKAFKTADVNVILNGKGGYATGVVVEVEPNLMVKIGAKGDSRALTLREGEIVKKGTTRMHSEVALKIECGELPPHAIHTAKGKNIIYSVIGNPDLPLCQTSFKGQANDQIILASDGLWDVVSDYEIRQLAAQSTGLKLEQALYNLAYDRNNSQDPFVIQFSPTESHEIRPLHANPQRCYGDNITIQVVELL